MFFYIYFGFLTFPSSSQLYTSFPFLCFFFFFYLVFVCLFIQSVSFLVFSCLLLSFPCSHQTCCIFYLLMTVQCSLFHLVDTAGIRACRCSESFRKHQSLKRF